jgi:pimeloyl-ACP methyl ester carboxylesterase
MKHRTFNRQIARVLIGVLMVFGISAPTTFAGASATEETIDGLFDVGGHRLYLSCKGTGSPTVVYMHGAIWDDRVVPHANALDIQERLADDVRVCLYDRRNTGLSDTVDAIQTPKDALRDMEQLLAAAGVEPHYVLLGASAGGLLSYLYANEHPDQVRGMVLLDSLFPDELALDRYWPREERYQSFHHEDQCCTLERLSHWKAMKKASRFIGREPAIPVTYLASAQEPWGGTGIPEYDDVILGLLANFVGRFSPGRLVWVDAPHFMEPVIPEQIATAVRAVIAQSSG